MSDELTALGRDDVDIAIRGGYSPNERIQALRLMDNEFVPAAAPRYLKIHGSPKSAFDLRQHKGLFFRTPAGPSPWLCESDGEWHDVSGEAIAISNNAPWLGRQALAAKGIILAPAWSLAGYLDSGELVRLDLSPAPTVSQNPNLAIYLLYQKQRYLVPKVKVAVDFLVARCR